MLVRLIGYVLPEQDELFLVYEQMPNGSMDTTCTSRRRAGCSGCIASGVCSTSTEDWEQAFSKELLYQMS
ncbi:hypothetical protein PR202_gb12188 [Eleusine coracana subsp. coracana]|uniref:Uncharacterized protein n=1 Tax=Eleusine coracana subsp. coracana TaxID=191504 RepID=A0AAV5EQD8_ELECO|nr:hypothetical protein PR202_gb12188 [Eleusine coracana subsp. coracana]